VSGAEHIPESYISHPVSKEDGRDESQSEDLASSENAFASACITSGLDRNLVHGITSIKQKIPPILVG
jgi:hypothetical protein